MQKKQGGIRGRRAASASSGRQLLGNSENFLSVNLYSKAFSPGSWHQPGLKVGISPGWCHQPGPKASFQQPKGRETKTFGPGWCHHQGLKRGIGHGWFHQPGLKRGIGPGWSHQPVPMDPSNYLFIFCSCFLVDSFCSCFFSPTSPSERHSQLFISPECRDDDEEAQCSCTLVSFKP